MKNNILTKTFCFLENHIALILGFSSPSGLASCSCCVGLLSLLPNEIAEKVGPQWISLDFLLKDAILFVKWQRGTPGDSDRFRIPAPSAFLLQSIPSSSFIRRSSGKYNKTKARLLCKRFPLREEQILIHGRQIVLL